jgi:hypothetical protein
MKPFNLDDALAGKPVITCDGRPVKIAGYNEDANDCEKLAVWIDGQIKSYYANGYSPWVGGSNPYRNLFMAPITRKEWIVRRVRPSGAIASRVFTTKAMAEYAAVQYQGATIHEITITE